MDDAETTAGSFDWKLLHEGQIIMDENLYWYGVDEHGNIACFAGTYGFKPKELSVRETGDTKMMAMLHMVEPGCSSAFTTNYQWVEQQGLDSFDDLLEEAEKGYYVFWDQDLQRGPLHPYELVAVPQQAKNIADFDINTQEQLRKYAFKGINFSRMTSLSPAKYIFPQPKQMQDKIRMLLLRLTRFLPD